MKELDAIRFHLVQIMGSCPSKQRMDGLGEIIKRLPPMVFDLQVRDARPCKLVHHIFLNYLPYVGTFGLQWLIGAAIIAAVRDDDGSIAELVHVANEVATYEEVVVEATHDRIFTKKRSRP